MTPLDVLVFGGRQRLDVSGVGRDFRECRANGHQPIRIRIRKRIEDEAVEQSKDQAVAANRQRQRQHRDGGKAGTPDELPARVAKVLHERFHKASPWWLHRPHRTHRAPPLA